MKFAGLLVIFALLHFVAAPSAEADSVLVGNSFVNLGLAVSSSEFLAQPFVLTATANCDFDRRFFHRRRKFGI